MKTEDVKTILIEPIATSQRFSTVRLLTRDGRSLLLGTLSIKRIDHLRTFAAMEAIEVS
jgi:hypothetical protein